MLDKIVYLFFFGLSVFIPKDRMLWVFGCYDGYVDNTRYFFEYASGQKRYNCYWLANTAHEKKQVEDLGCKSVIKKSWKGYFLSARANVTFICTGYSDVNRLLSLNSKVINFWHGTPIKKIYKDSGYDINRFGDNAFSRMLSSSLMSLLVGRYSFFYASNSLERELVCNASGLRRNKSLALGAPRFDIIRSERNEFLRAFLDGYKKVYLYAPTWREKKNWSDSFKISCNALKSLESALQKNNAILLVKTHPLTSVDEIKSFGLKASERIVFLNDLGVTDINEVYCFTDVLITDVSSAMFDYMIFAKPILIFMPDVDEYISGERGIYDYVKTVIYENSIRSWSGIVSLIDYDSGEKLPLLKIANIDYDEVAFSLGSRRRIYEDINSRFYKVS